MSRDYEQQQQHQIIESYQNRCVLSGPNKLRATASGRSAQCSCPEAQEAASQIVSSQVMDFVSALKIVFTGLGVGIGYGLGKAFLDMAPKAIGLDKDKKGSK